MDRRKFIAVGAAALLAGCDSQNDGTDTPADGETPGGADGTDDGNGGGGATGTPTEDRTPTPGGECDVDVTYESCTSFTVTADSYGTVFASLAGGGTEQFDGDYSGEETFETDESINYVLVSCPAGSYEHPNPDAAECRQTEGS